jgi:aminomethyltransferase
MESLTTIDLQSLPANSGSLTVFTNDQGGIRDDLIVTKTNDDYLLVNQ